MGGTNQNIEHKIIGAAPPYTYVGNEPPLMGSVAVMVSEKIANLSSGNAIQVRFLYAPLWNLFCAHGEGFRVEQ